ncbi:Gfo/Idh/MocA family oxidoreductase [Sphingobacterium daejeonense]|uniref:Gfo/Idh/MocA family oxidoreductase n=1 Tax=Sphingobacterium daejeonense TaxID=371142 RepID=UPI0021A515B9|nr:Gfo/Idh/MocA family oxidoreductase [Sphingobacterium daejeonense]MCT1530139.1 Gfo/Idh/MocA family oxidoreductase [Sphingobacterium daejeonense]
MIKIGMIGMSPGNAHPYSWSAIINGKYDVNEINNAGFPAVSDYLEANKDTLGVLGAQVTHIWCDEINRAKSIAISGQIEYVVQNLEDIIGEVDAIILGRDDPENHWELAKPFLDANIPIFIDKPLAINLDELISYEQYIKNGRFLMSCSSMRYSAEILAAKSSIKSLGKIHLLTVVGKKDWKKYGVHMVEATMSLLNDPKALSVQYLGKDGYDIVLLEINTECYASIHLINDITGTFQVSVYGENAWLSIDIKNSYSMFKENILEFVKSLNQKKPTLDFNKTKNVIQIVAAALKSKNLSGEKINL